MAQIDANIALGVKPVQIEDPINRFARQQELSVNMMKGQEMQRGLQEEEQIRNYLRGADLSKPETRAELNRFGKTGLGYGKLLAEQEKAGLERQKLKVDIDEKEIKAFRQRTADLAFNPSPENITAHIQDGILRKQITPEQGAATLQQTLAMNPTQRQEYFTLMGVEADKRLTDITSRRGQDISAQTTRRGQDMQYNPELQATIANAKAYGDTLGKNKAVAQQALPGALASAEEGIRLIDEMVGKQEIKDKNGKVIQAGTKPHPGFRNYVGAALVPGMRFVEGSDTASYDVRQKQIEGKAFLEAFQALKGGGSITEKEGEKGTQAIMRMNKASKESEYIAAARELQGILRTGMDRSRARAGQTSPVVAPSAAPAANLGSNINTPGGNAPAGGLKFLGFEESPVKK